MKAICAWVVFWSLSIMSASHASPYYPFRSHQAELTVIDTDNLTRAQVQDILCVARNVYHEARGQTVQNQMAVAWVTRNRSKITGKSLCEVVFEAYLVQGRKRVQFAWTTHNHTRLMERSAWDQAQVLAWRVLQAHVSQDFTKRATHFYERANRPPWSVRGRDHQVIGAHVFLRLPRFEEVAQDK